MSNIINGILESALYCEDLDESYQFYTSVFGFKTLVSEVRLNTLNVADKQVLLLFKRGASLNDVITPGGVIPHHDGNGPIHLALSINLNSVNYWKKTLKKELLKLRV